MTSQATPSERGLACNAKALALETARLMLPDDANGAGNVHGGTVLRMIEQAGFVVATRLCNWSTGEPHPQLIGSLVQIYQMSFFQPMHVGELARLTATPTFTSNRSIEVQVDVFAENLLTGEVRHTNHAILCYAAVNATTGTSIDFAIPQLLPASDDEEQLFAGGLQRYQAWKASAGSDSQQISTKALDAVLNAAEREGSVTSLVQIMLPSDCQHGKVVAGGVIMKLMDNAAAVCAARHCHSNIVTVTIDNLIFTARVQLGDVVFARAKAVFASAQTIDILISVEVERFGIEGRLRTTQGIFTFASLDPNGRPRPIRRLEVKTEEEVALFEVRKEKYEERKRLRRQARAAAAAAATAAAAPNP
eukprot:EG_transcript_9957